MNMVLMDTKRHKTMPYRGGVTVIMPVEVSPRVILGAEFRPSGDFLYGDPIFYQVRGPEIPAKWWDR